MRAFFLPILLCIAAVSVAAQHKFTMTVGNTSTMTGRQLGVRVFDVTTSTEAVLFIEPSLPAGDTYLRDVWGMIQGHDYNVDVYIDVNGNGRYDAPPIDLAWRQTFTSVVGPVSTSYDITATTTDVNFPERSTAELHYVAKNYVGSWKNITYNTTGNATATSQLNYKAGTAMLSLTASDGAFGLPTPVTFTFTGTLNAAGDSADLRPEPPVTGFLRFVRGRVFGLDTLTVPPVMLEINGNYGENQVMFAYGMNGAFNATGVMTLIESTVTDVAAETSSVLLSPNPTVTQTVDIEATQPFDRVEVHSLTGELLQTDNCAGCMNYSLRLDNIAPGMYLLSMHHATAVAHATLIVR